MIPKIVSDRYRSHSDVLDYKGERFVAWDFESIQSQNGIQTIRLYNAVYIEDIVKDRNDLVKVFKGWKHKASIVYKESADVIPGESKIIIDEMNYCKSKGISARTWRVGRNGRLYETLLSGSKFPQNYKTPIFYSFSRRNTFINERNCV